MSNKALTYVLEHSKTKGSARVLMLVLADMANDDGECWPGRANLSKKCNISRRQVSAMIRDCEEMGELAVIQRSHMAEDNRTNKYLIVGLAAETNLEKAREAKPRKRRSNIADNGTRVPIVEDGGQVNTGAPGVGNTDAPGVLNTSSPNPSIEPTVEPTTPPASAESVSDAGKSRYKSFAERHPEMSEDDLETAKRAAMADVIDMSGSRYVNNTLKDALEKAVAHVFETGGGEARVIARFLRGQSSSKDGDQYREHCVDFRGAAVEADELVEWSAWYRETYPDRTLVRRPAALAGSILAWRDRGGESKRPSSIADVWGIVN